MSQGEADSCKEAKNAMWKTVLFFHSQREAFSDLQSVGGRRKEVLCLSYLVAFQAILLSGASAQGTQSLLSVINTRTNLTIFAELVKSAGLTGVFNDSSQQLTVFAPSDSAFTTALQLGFVTCISDFYLVTTCKSLDDLNSSTDLQEKLRTFVVNGSIAAPALNNATRLETIGSTTQSVTSSASSNGQALFGDATLTTVNVPASNGLLHVLGSVPTTDLSVNETSLLVASQISDFGPFNQTQRAALITADSNTLPANIPSMVKSYQRQRVVVDLPQGGLVNPMSLAYDPLAMYRLLRASPPHGYTDSEAPPNSPGTGGTLASASGAASPAAPGSPLPGSTSRAATQTPAPTGVARLTVSNQTVSSFSVGNSSRSQAPSTGSPSTAEGNILKSVCDSDATDSKWSYLVPSGIVRPADNDTLAFMTVMELASLFRSHQVTAVELAEIFTARMKRYDYVLEAVVTYTWELALQQAETADRLLQGGTWLGPLHGIPYGLKDIISVKEYPTTWGAPQFRNQYINEDANVYLRLSAAGAVLIAKLATGEMAYDDVWWGGRVKNPWNIAQGSSGSSAGPMASVVAGTVPFSVGTETEGSLMSPAQTCGGSAMRPSLGSVGRSWTMTLADSLDKLGPICRSVEDCAVVFDVIRGQDDMDPTSRDAHLIDPFALDVSELTVGYVSGMDTSAPEVLEVLREQGVTLKPFTLSYGVTAEDLIMTVMLSEAAAHFDYWQRSGQDAQNRRQDYWPPLLRLARFIPAVEYIQAQRSRSMLAVQVLGSLKAAGIDAFIANSTVELAMCNLVGLPTVSVPIGFGPVSGAATSSNRRRPRTVGFFGWPNGEPEVLALGMAWQNATSYHLKQPPIDDVEASVLATCQPYSRCTLPASSLGPASGPSITISSSSSSAAPAAVADSG